MNTKDIANLKEELFKYFELKDFVATKISEEKFQITLLAFVFWVTQPRAIFTFLKVLIK
jgi:hypothetical protein